LLDLVPCDSSFSTCRFIKDAYESKETLTKERERSEDIKKSIEESNNKLKKIDLDKTKEYLEKYERLCEKKFDFSSRITLIQLNIQQNSVKILHNQQELSVLEQKLVEYEKNKDIIENYEKTLEEKVDLEEKLGIFKKKLIETEQQLVSLYKKMGGFEQQLEDLREKKEELEKLRKEYAAYEFYTQAMHFDGIAYNIIQQYLPLINDQISKTLTTVAPFRVFFETDGNKLDIKIQHPGFSSRSLDMASGAEKTLAALAIRMSLIKVCNLPKPNFLILDEPAIGLDEQGLEGFTKMLERLKEDFEFIILITHLENLKESVDMEITINTQDKYACVYHTTS
jgi:DNA repair exonuclease SbcCD ATPase subunit